MCMFFLPTVTRHRPGKNAAVVINTHVTIEKYFVVSFSILSKGSWRFVLSQNFI
jgi:hypothetical protein